NSRVREARGVVNIGAAHVPLFPIWPYFTGAVLYSCDNFIYRHKKAHQDPAWARVHMTGHYDHHMGPDQDANWCVTRPWFDWIMGTRKPYAFSIAETRSRIRRLKRQLRQTLSPKLARLSSLPPPCNEN